MKFSRSRVQDLESEKAWPSLPLPMGKTKPIAHCSTAWGKPPASVVAAQANPAPPLPLTAVMTKAKAAPKIRNSKGSGKKWGKKWSPKWRTTAAAAADLDSLPEPQQPAQEAVPPVPKEESDAGEVTSQTSDEKKEDKHEKKEDKYEKKEDKHEEKTESDVDESASSAAVEPTPVPEIAQATEAPQALCLCVCGNVPLANERSSHTNAQCLP